MMPTRRSPPAALLALMLGALSAGPATAGGRAGTVFEPTESTDRLIVRLRDPAERDPARRIDEIAGRLGERVRHLRRMSGGNQVLLLPRTMSRADARLVARRLAGDPTVAYAEPDLRMKPMRVPNDSLYAQQWHYFESVGGINLPAAWDVSVGSSDITVAVIDTGVRPHADLAGRLVAGYDFIADASVSNDGDGRDADAGDPGDYCNGGGSSWHGTHVAGTIGAVSNNGTGVAGVNWTSKIQPVRVLGACGGYTSDIADGMRWAAGIAVAGAPVNATPARVLNLSMGGSGVCGTTFQNAVNDVVARNVAVVIAAGNNGADSADTSPGNCNGVIAVAATVRNGGKASYSNYGAKVAIAAPGGGGGDGVLSTLNSGGTLPGADSYASYQGTSMAAPHVAGVVSLMLSVAPSLTPAQVLAKLQSSARTFPTGTGADCTKTLCGAGIVDAAAALASAPPATQPPAAARVNWALAANGGVMTASSTINAGYPPSGANDGNRSGSNWGSGGGWNDATGNAWGDWLQVDFGTARTVAEVDVFMIQDNYQNPIQPTEAMVFTQYGLTDFEVQYWTGSTWEPVPGGTVSGNNKVWRRFTFTPVSTSRLRVVVANALQGYSRVVELEAYSTVAASTPSTPTVRNVALLTNGGSATSSSNYNGYGPGSVINGDRRGLNWGADGGWNDATGYSWPDTLQIAFDGTKSITEIDVYTIQDAYANPQEPTETLTFTQYGVTDFQLQYWNGTAWMAIPGGSVTGNDRVWRKFTFAAISTSAIRVVVSGGVQGYSRIIEVEAYGL